MGSEHRKAALRRERMDRWKHSRIGEVGRAKMEWQMEWRMVEPMLLGPKQFDLGFAKDKEEPVEEPVGRE